MQQRQAALAHIPLKVNRSQKLSDVLGQLVHTAGDLLPASAGASIVLWDEEPAHRVGQEAEAAPEPKLGRSHDAAAQWLAEHREPLIVPDTRTSSFDLQSIFEQAGIRSFVMMPLIEDQHMLGTLNTFEMEPRVYSREDMDFLGEVANRAVIAINQSRLMEQVGQMETRDELTEVANRRYFFQAGEHEMIRAHQFGRPLVAIFFDADHMQRLNQTHNHATGDQILRAIAQMVRENIREVDILGRYGGDEFVILLPETNLAAGCHVAERVRRKISEAPLAVGNESVRATISLGVAEITEETRQLADLLASAESAMRKAKQAGRNRIFFADHSLARHFYFDFLPA